MAGGVPKALMNGGGITTTATTTEVLFLVPELLFLAFVAVVAVGSSTGLVASIHSSRERWHSRAPTVLAYSGSGEAHLWRPLATLLLAAGVAMLAVMAVHALVLSLRVVLEAPVGVVIVAAATAVATVVLAVVVSVVVLATILVAAGTSAVALVSIYEAFKEGTTST